MATVSQIKIETRHSKTFRLALSQPVQFLAGQYFVVRLRAPDGYTAQRSYSVASAPELSEGASASIEITVERLEGGEVSVFLDDEVVPGDELEVRGPIGGWFVWRADRRALLVGGGSGIVPLMAMLRLARRLGRSDLVRLVVSVRRQEDLYYSDELPGPETAIVYTREAPPASSRPAGRLAAADLAGAIVGGTTAYVCGSSGFADHVTGLLTGLAPAPEQIRVERFGPTG